MVQDIDFIDYSDIKIKLALINKGNVNEMVEFYELRSSE